MAEKGLRKSREVVLFRRSGLDLFNRVRWLSDANRRWCAYLEGDRCSVRVLDGKSLRHLEGEGACDRRQLRGLRSVGGSLTPKGQLQGLDIDGHGGLVASIQTADKGG